ncbi:unnamed protein product [Boreogadus saida]
MAPAPDAAPGNKARPSPLKVGVGGAPCSGRHAGSMSSQPAAALHVAEEAVISIYLSMEWILLLHATLNHLKLPATSLRTEEFSLVWFTEKINQKTGLNYIRPMY